MKLGQLFDFNGHIEEIKQNTTLYKNKDSYETETYMAHDKSI